MPVTILDMIVIVVVLLSALLAALRGFTREVLAIGSWAVAAVVAYATYKQAVPLAMQYVSTNEKIATPVAAGGIFLLTLLIAYFISAKISDMILDSRVGALDRTLGFLFGAARGFLLAVVGFIFFAWLAPDDSKHPAWVKDSRLKPMLASAGATLKSFLPENPDEALQRLRNKALEGDAPRDQAPAPQQPQRRSEAPAQPAAQPVSQPTDRAALQRMIDGGQRPAQNR
jgi:membrane protein required for colicin V production